MTASSPYPAATSENIPIYKQRHQFIADYFYDVIGQSHFESILSKKNNFLFWLIAQKFDLTEWNGVIDVTLPLQSHSEVDIKWYLEQLWFRQLSGSETRYFLISSICILDIIDAIKRHKAVIDAKCVDASNGNEQHKNKKKKRDNDSQTTENDSKSSEETQPPTKRRKLNNAQPAQQSDVYADQMELSIPEPPVFNFDEEESENEMDKLKGINAKCICENKLIPMTTQRAVKLMDVEEFLCDKCDCVVEEYIFHCGKSHKKHPDGYDLCVECAKKSSLPPQAIKEVKSISISVPQIYSNNNHQMMMPNLEYIK